MSQSVFSCLPVMVPGYLPLLSLFLLLSQFLLSALSLDPEYINIHIHLDGGDEKGNYCHYKTSTYYYKYRLGIDIIHYIYLRFILLISILLTTAPIYIKLLFSSSSKHLPLNMFPQNIIFHSSLTILLLTLFPKYIASPS